MISSKASLAHLGKCLSASSEVLLRADLNVPLRDGLIRDPKRIKGMLSSMQRLCRPYRKF